MTLSLRKLALTTALGLAFAGAAQADVTIRYLASHGGLSAHELAGELGYFDGTGITLENVREYAESGVHWISIGALTHSAPALDLSLLVEPL